MIQQISSLTMESAIIQQIVAFRKDLHSHPEISFAEFQTHAKVKNMLLSFGLKQKGIREYSREGHRPTGLIADLRGEAQLKGKNYCVAFRADMDALAMEEDNPHLPYASKHKGAAHMCGHDGHTACLLGFAQLFIKKLSQIPKNKTVRLIFQPSEEGPTEGAKFMIERGCLEGVDEVYGMHNSPLAVLGTLQCKEGYMFYEGTMFLIKIMGDGGHASFPGGLRISIKKGIQFYSQIQQYIAKLQQQGRKFICVFPFFNSGTRFNVIEERTTIEGQLKTVDTETRDLVKNKVKELLKGIEEEGFRVEYQQGHYHPTINTKEESQHVLRVAKEMLGAEKVGAEGFPLAGSEDFAEYLMIKPGAFFALGTKEQEKEPFCHSSHFDFNDRVIPLAMHFWLRLAQDRIQNT